MAQYNYDGGLVAYFILTFLFLVLVPLTFSLRGSLASKPIEEGCECSECLSHRQKLAKSQKASPFAGLSSKAVLALSGWVVFAGVFYWAATSSTSSIQYDPFTILGIRESASEKEIKKHYKKLSLKFHPDTVKLAVNQTIEEAQEYFIKLTKAYKALTDEEVRRNYLEFGDPDGKQSVTIGLALPAWLIDAHNSPWVLAMYGLLFGGLLPWLVGRWWFGSRTTTKDGVQAPTAAIFFKDIVEDVTNQQLILSLAKGCAAELPNSLGIKDGKEAAALTERVLDALSSSGESIPAGIRDTQDVSPSARFAYILLSAHLLRIPVPTVFEKAQQAILVHIPTLLNSQLAMALSHNWYLVVKQVMVLSSCFAQALAPAESPFLQFPGVTKEHLAGISGDSSLKHLVDHLYEAKHPETAKGIEKVAERWGRLEVVDAKFKVIGERIITPGAFVNVVFKLRLGSPLDEQPNGVSTASSSQPMKSDEDAKEIGASEIDISTPEDEDEDEFLTGKRETEALVPGQRVIDLAHTPRWPRSKRPSWWVFLADMKTNKMFVYPIRISEVPQSDDSLVSAPSTKGAPYPHNYRTYKMQFQAPQQVGTYTLRLIIISDTFANEEVGTYLQLKVEEFSALDEEEQPQEDDISEPDEDTLAGQMAVMRGGKVKKSPYHGESDEESSSDDEDNDSDSSSDDD